jgi:serine/threonine-protein kinase
MSTIDRLFQIGPGGRLGARYRLQKCLGDGSYGFVWKAVRIEDDEIVAVKIPKEQGGRNRDLEEGRELIDAPRHSNVVQVFWMGRVPPEREVFAIEMEFFSSNTLAFLLDTREERLVASYGYLLDLFGQILDGACHLHALGITHGDIKPQNVLVGGGVAKLTDFGSSFTTQDIYARSRENGGTVLYSPPESAGLSTSRPTGLAIAHDVYSLGVLLYQLLTGRLPHDTLAQVVHHTPFPSPCEVNASIVPELEAVVLKALEAQPEDRWTSVDGMRAAFLRARQVQLASHGERPILPAFEPQTDWSSQVVSLMDRQVWRDAQSVARAEFERSGDPHAFLLMVRASVRDSRYFDAIQLLEANPGMLEANCAVAGDLEQLALEAYLRTERVNEAARMVDRCIQRQGDQPGLLLRKAALLGMRAKYKEAAEILLALNRRLPKRPAILQRLVLVYEQMRDFEQAEAFKRLTDAVPMTEAQTIIHQR